MAFHYTRKPQGIQYTGEGFAKQLFMLRIMTSEKLGVLEMAGE